MNDEPSAYVLGPEEGEALWFFGTLATVKASAERGAGRFALIHQVAPRGVATPLHVQPQDDESFYVLEGEMTFFLGDGQPIRAGAGTFVHVPKGSPHAFRVDSETATFFTLTNAQHESFIRAVAEPARERTIPPQGPPDMQKIGAAAEEYAVEILGPPPGGEA
jgi:quercetin dioxygenase-like cupin family protein